MSAPERYGNVRIATIKAAYDDLRAAVRAHDPEAAEAALDRYEQWADYAFGQDPVTDPRVKALVEAAKSLGLRELVAGWNGEGRETPYEPHPPHLWAKITTTCGTVYALDAALRDLEQGKGET